MCELFVLLILVEWSRESELAKDNIAPRISYRLTAVKEHLPYFKYERLSVEESVGQVFCLGVNYQIDPRARRSLHMIIKDESMLPYHGVAISALALEGDSDDLQICLKYVEACRGKELDGRRRHALRRVFQTLAHFEIRDVDGADVALRRMCGREYWRGLILSVNESEKLDNLHDELIYEAVNALAITRCADLQETVGKIIDAGPSATSRNWMRGALNAEQLDEFVKQHEMRIWPLIAPSWRRRAVAKFNGDLENPGPLDPAEFSAD